MSEELERKEMLSDIIAINTKALGHFFQDDNDWGWQDRLSKMPKEVVDDYNKLSEGQKELIAYLVYLIKEDEQYIDCLDFVRRML